MHIAIPSQRLARRSVLKFLAFLAATSSGRFAWAQDFIAAVPSLGEIAAARHLFFGTAFDVDIFDNQALAELYLHHARILTTDHSLKFGSIRPTEEDANFGNGDRLVDFANHAHLPIRGHNLIWNDFNPSWVAKLSKEQRIYWLDRHIDEVVGRYAGRIQSWDVVNEPFWPQHGKPGGFRDGPWYEAMGKDYIRRAFVRADRADRKAKLVLNEAGPEWAFAYGPTDAYRTGILQLIDELRDAGARIDVIGLECHWLADVRYDPNLLINFLGQLADKKVDVYITELDVGDNLFPDDIARRDEMVASRYFDLLSVALRAPVVKAVITWQLADSESWLFLGYKSTPGSQRRPRPLPFDEKYQPKPAYHAIVRALRNVHE